MALPHRKGLDRDEALLCLAKAEADIRADRFAEAAQHYRSALALPALLDLPALHTEALGNYGALLLHEAHQQAAASERLHRLNSAIASLEEARRLSRASNGSGNTATIAANLALAYFRRFEISAEQADLMSAHMALDGAEAENGETDMQDWIRSIRDLLLDHIDRRRLPR